MWQRFTERARKVIFFSQEEAGLLGEHYVSTEHILLGLIRENDCVAARVLNTMRVSLGEIRSEIEKQVTRGDGRMSQDMQLTPRGKRVIDLAYDEARQLSNNYIGTEHLLLGLIREGEGVAGRVLKKLGVDIERTRREVMDLQDGELGVPSPLKRSSPHAGILRTALDSLMGLLGKSDKPESEQMSAEQAILEIFDGDSGWRGKSLVSLDEITPDQFRTVLGAARALKVLHEARQDVLYWNYPRTLGMIFEKPSLRTRVSFEAGMTHLGGHAIYLAPGDIGLGSREPVADVAQALSRWVDIISARVYKHETVMDLAANATIPVINALSDREHPIQAFADMLTLEEQKGELGNGLKMAYIGDGNNVLHALLLACAKLGVNLSAACPEGYFPDPDYVRMANEAAKSTGARIEITSDPTLAVKDADALYTDVWTSMGQESEKESRVVEFAPYQINSQLVAKAKPDAIVLHCLPAHCGEEIAADVFDKHRTVIMDQAENRMHTQKALIALMLGI